MAGTEQFSLRWNNFHSNLTSGFHDLLEAAEMVDVTLAVEGHFLQAHKLVLSICSPYFRQMFKANPCKHPIVIIKDVGHEHMKDILEFMYMGEVNVLRENLSTFLRTAELLQVKGLTGDDSSDTSSRKDDKLDVFADPEEESDLMQFSHLMDSDVELPTYQSSTTLPLQTLSTSGASTTKRPSKNSHSNPNIKRSKSDTSSQLNKSFNNKQLETDNLNNIKTNTTNTNTTDTEEYLDNSQIVKTEKSSIDHLDEASMRDEVKQMFENNMSSSMDPNTSDQDVLLCSVDHKGHVYCPYCCRKFVNRYNLKVHIRDKHEDNPINLDCRICGKTMRNRSCLRVHMYHHRKQQVDSAVA